MEDALIIAGSMAAAFVVAMIFNIAGRKIGRQMDRQFDERQIIARNKAYMTGFFVVLLLMMADILLKMTGNAFYMDPLGELSAVLISIGVFAVLAIWNDAFLIPTQKPGLLILLYCVVTIERMIRFLFSLKNGECFSDGRLTLSCINGVAALIFFAVFVSFLIKQHSSGSED